jgi:TatA/E family protein of Tat protein translocase
MIGTTEIILILIVVMLLFGTRKIPEFAKSLGSGIKEFKNSLREVKTETEINYENGGKEDGKKD